VITYNRSGVLLRVKGEKIMKEIMLVKLVEDYDYNDIICSFEIIKQEVNIGDIIDNRYKVVGLTPIRVIEIK